MNMEQSYRKLADRMDENSRHVEQALEKYMSRTDKDYGVIFDAQRYSLLGGGKRVRPFLVNECAIALGGDTEKSMPLACAVEMIHTYSLIHDDLPCMDDDDMRRGKPSNHVRFGYANALLAGDALLTNAFRVIGEASSIDAETKAKAVALLAFAAGECGMIGGQIIDLMGEKCKLDFETLLRLHAHKTGALIRVSAQLGCLAAGYGTYSEEAKALTEYAEKIGLAFQVVDDILDATATEEQLGKSVGSDADSNKTTFLSFYSVEQARAYAERLTEEAITAVSHVENSEVLTDLACFLLDRKS